MDADLVSRLGFGAARAFADTPPPLVGRVLQRRVVIYSRDEPARVRFESRRLRGFLDFQIRAEPLDRAVLERADADLRCLHEMAQTPLGDVIDDLDRLDAVKYRFVTAIEGLIDAAHHVIASERLRAPTTYADAFAVLGEAGLLDGALAATAQEIARFRNLLVHGYAEVDDERVVTLLMTRLDDLDALRKALGIRHHRRPGQAVQDARGGGALPRPALGA